MQFFQVYLIKKFNFDQTDIGHLFGYIGIWIAFTQGVLTRFFASRYTPPKILRISLIGLGCSLWLILFPSTAWMMLFTQPLVAIFQGLSQPNLTSIVSVLAPKESQGEMLGIQQSVQSAAFAIPPLIAGVLATLDVRLPIFFAGLSVLIAWTVFILFFKSAAFKAEPLQ